MSFEHTFTHCSSRQSTLLFDVGKERDGMFLKSEWKTHGHVAAKAAFCSL